MYTKREKERNEEDKDHVPVIVKRIGFDTTPSKVYSRTKMFWKKFLAVEGNFQLVY